MSPILPLWLLTVQPTPAQVVGDPGTPRYARAEGPAALLLSSASWQRDLESFSSRWSVRFQIVSRPEPPNPAARTNAAEMDLADQIEAALDAARTALGSLDADAAERTLADIERKLDEHPELPQAAWLMAEHHYVEAELLERAAVVDRAGLKPTSTRQTELRSRARELRNDAEALEGIRAMPFREEKSKELGPPPMTGISLGIAGLRPRDEIEWDGALQSSALTTRPGKHHVRVLRGERLVWAGWIQVTPDQRVLSLPVSAPAPCSGEELMGALDGDPAPIAAGATECPQWAIARMRGPLLEVALCRRAQCGRWYGVQTEPVAFRGPAQPTERRGIPSWALYAGLGAGAALALGVVAVTSGWFDRNPPHETWRYEGLR
ncbi:MAG TPA: hypothetical protein VFQ61_17340 [Polyangiaceae bacterium]|nr:hypothetical protein [Polyangiaceae bacterium]